MILNGLLNREITGKRIRINHVYPLRKTSYACCVCNQPVTGIILDLNEDMDIFEFRFHYIIPMLACHKCKDPAKI
jgi:hypothetical protein